MVRQRRRLALTLLVFVFSGCGEDAAPAEPLGVFVLDEAAMIKAQRDQGVPETVARRHAAALRVTVDFKTDGTFELIQKREGDPLISLAGTWTRAGNVVTVTTTHRGDALLETPEVVQGQLTAGLLVLGTDGPLDDRFVLRRK